jgi:uncharacterized DUF497 family protein
MEFEWDDAKDEANRRKHGIGFREAAKVFRGTMVVSEDTRREYGERRLIALGEYAGAVIRVVFTERGNAIASSRHGRQIEMTARTTKKRSRIVRYKSLDDMPPPKPLSKAFRELSDAEVERRAAADPDAGILPPGFWDIAKVMLPETKQQITLRLDPEVIRFFKRTGKGYQSRMGAVLRSYVEAKRKRA